MKNRVLLTMLIIFIVLAGLLITCGTIFVVREIEIVDTAGDTTTLTAEQKDTLSEAINLRGKNILFNLHQDKITTSIKNVDPTLKVQNIRAEFPNKVIITVSRRVPVYYCRYTDQETKESKICYLDAEMYVVENGTMVPGHCVDISGANIIFDGNPVPGNLAAGLNPVDRAKITQLQVIANYFTTLTDFKINYDDTTTTVGGTERVCLYLQINNDVLFKIKIDLSLNEDFVQLLKLTYAAYQDPDYPVTGTAVYEGLYNKDNGKAIVYINDGVKEHRWEYYDKH